MRRAGIRVHAIVEPSAPRDSASQVSRATLGLREMLLRGALRPVSELPKFHCREARRFPHAVAPGFRETGARRPGQSASPFRIRRQRVYPSRDLGRDRDPGHSGGGRCQARRRTFGASAQLDPVRKINRTMEEIPSLDVEGFTQYLSLNEVYHLAIFDLAKNQPCGARLIKFIGSVSRRPACSMAVDESAR